MNDFISNTNDHFSWYQAYDKTYRGGGSSIKLGKVVNVSSQNHLAQTYDVVLLDGTDAYLSGVRYQSRIGGFNGVGSYAPLEAGTIVSLATNSGTWDDCYIVGCPYLEGPYTDYYSTGNLQAPGTIYTSTTSPITGEYNQPSGHPNRITQPDSYFTFYGAKNLSPSGDYTSPEFATNLQTKANSNPLPGSIDLWTKTGDHVTYTYGSNILYCDSNQVNIAAGDTQSKANKLMSFANYHAQLASALQGTQVATTPTPTTSGITPLVSTTPANLPSSLRSPFTITYHITENNSLAQTYASLAQQALASSNTWNATINQLAAIFPSEIPGISNLTSGGTSTTPSYTPSSTSNSNTANAGVKGPRSTGSYSPLSVFNKLAASTGQSTATSTPPLSQWVSAYNTSLNNSTNTDALIGDDPVVAFPPTLLSKLMLVGIPSLQISQLSQVTALPTTNLTGLFIMIGGTDLNNGVAASTIISNLVTYVQSMPTPNVVVTVFSVIPRTMSNLSINDPSWANLNSQISTASTGQSWNYMDVTTPLLANTTQYYTLDQSNLSYQGYVQWATTIGEQIGSTVNSTSSS